MNKALDFRMPQRMPQVSRLEEVFREAARRKECRSWEGRKTVRRGSPFSRYAEGLKLNSSRSGCGEVARGAGVDVSRYFPGSGGADGRGSLYFPGTGGGRAYS